MVCARGHDRSCKKVLAAARSMWRRGALAGGGIMSHMRRRAVGSGPHSAALRWLWCSPIFVATHRAGVYCALMLCLLVCWCSVVLLLVCAGLRGLVAAAFCFAVRAFCPVMVVLHTYLWCTTQCGSEAREHEISYAVGWGVRGPGCARVPGWGLVRAPGGHEAGLSARSWNRGLARGAAIARGARNSRSPAASASTSAGHRPAVPGRQSPALPRDRASLHQ
jgi:hypothetical protein